VAKKKHDIDFELVRVKARNLPFEEPSLYKIYNDGGHYVATRVLESRPRMRNNLTNLSDADEYFDKLYSLAKNESLKGSALFDFIRSEMLAIFPNLAKIDEFITEHIKQKIHNFYSRLKRFKRKANLNRWNKFVTITYDDEKHDEYNFRVKLRKCLSNLHSRRGWKYMGVFERAPETGRLHFHALMYIPENEMVGNLELRKDWSTSQNKMQETIANTFFEERFGRNDFEELTDADIKSGRALDYLTKYLHKTNDKIVYSRGIPTEIFAKLEEEAIATEMQDYVIKFVLFDDWWNIPKSFYVPPKQLSIFDCLNEKPKVLTA